MESGFQTAKLQLLLRPRKLRAAVCLYLRNAEKCGNGRIAAELLFYLFCMPDIKNAVEPGEDEG